MLTYEDNHRLISSPTKLSIRGNRTNNFKKIFHFHPGIEIIYVHEGTGRIILEQDIYEIKPGSLLLIKPFQPHFLQMDTHSGNQPYIRSLIKYEPEFLTEYLKVFPSVHKFHTYLWRDPDILPVQELSEPEQLEHLLQHQDSWLKSHSSPDKLESNVLFILSVLHHLQPIWKKRDFTTPPALQFSPIVIDIINWVDKHYMEEFQLEAMSAAVCMSPTYISHLFKKSTGHTITQFLTVRRLKQACLLLKTTSLSIQEIGEKSGWPNFSYFSQIFRKHIGMSPKQYRASVVK